MSENLVQSQEINSPEKLTTKGDKLFSVIILLLVSVFIMVLLQILGLSGMGVTLIFVFIFLGCIFAIAQIANRLDTEEEKNAFFKKAQMKIDKALLENNLEEAKKQKIKVINKYITLFYHEKNVLVIFIKGIKSFDLRDYSLINKAIDNCEWIIKNFPNNNDSIRKVLDAFLKDLVKQKERAIMALDKKIEVGKVEKALKEIDLIIPRINSLL